MQPIKGADGTWSLNPAGDFEALCTLFFAPEASRGSVSYLVWHRIVWQAIATHKTLRRRAL